MKSKFAVSLMVIAAVLCPVFAFAADTDEKEPVMMDEKVLVADDEVTGNVVAEAVETEEADAPETAKEIKTEAKEALKEMEDSGV